MKRFLIRFLSLLLFMFIIDRGIGSVFSYFVNNSKGGMTRHHQYIAKEMKNDILIFGSSRAVHHYDAKMISDTLGSSCYNCGQNGNGIILNYAELSLLKKRYLPKYIIYDVYPKFDIYQNDNHKYLSWLRPYYYESKVIKEIFNEVDKKEKYKMLSYLYLYSFSPLEIVSDFFYPITQINSSGFYPLKGRMNSLKISKNRKVQNNEVIDPLKKNYLEKMICENSNIQFVFVVSPCWNGYKKETYKPIVDFCQKYGIPFINFADDAKYLHKNQYFRDGSHMNEYGAKEFTKDLLVQLKGLMATKQRKHNAL